MADGCEQPAHVGVPQAPECPESRLVRAARIAFLVGEVVVLAVVGHPLDHRALDRERPENREAVADDRTGLERAVGEQAMEPHGDAQAGRCVPDRE
jgi:hypothetical protein